MRATAVLLAAAASTTTTSPVASAFTAPPRSIPNSPTSARRLNVAPWSSSAAAATGRRDAVTMGVSLPRIGGGDRRRERRGAGSRGGATRYLGVGSRPLFRGGLLSRGREAVGARVASAVPAVRRAATVLLATAIVALSSAPLSARPSHASSSNGVVPIVRAAPSSSSSRSRVVLASTSSANLDGMIDRYVRDRMFNDDSYDPFESAYREAHYDQSGSPYPSIINEAATDILGRKEVAAQKGREGSVFDAVWTKLDSFADGAERRFGISKSLTLSSAFIAIFCAPVVVLFLGAIAFGERQKEKTEKMAVDRYGYGLNDLSAAEKIGEDIEAPDDDEEDDEDDDDDDDEEE